MHGGEFLQASHSPEAEHCSFPPSEGEVRVSRSVVLVATDLLAVDVADFLHRSAVGRASVRDNYLRIAVTLHCFFEEFQCSSFVASFGDE